LLAEVEELRQRVRYLEMLATDRRSSDETVDESRERYKTLFETATEGILTIDIESLEFRYANPAITEILGYSITEFKGMRLAEIHPPEDREMVLDGFARLAGGEESSLSNVRCVRRDGRLIHVDVSATLGIVAGRECVINFYRDVTERKQAEDRALRFKEELERSHDDILSIINRLQLIIAMADKSGRVTFLSDSGGEVFDIPPVQAVGRTWFDLFPIPSLERMKLRAMSKRPEAQRAPTQAIFEMAGGRNCWLEVEVLDDPRGDERRIVLVRDVTELQDLRRRADKKAQFYELLGRSDAMQRVFRRIREVAGHETTVLIEGETGTGKELAARAIHGASARADKPLVVVNCAGLTDSLLGSQLFGHRRGAFTGAVANQEGVFEAAHSGTIFLDEIGDISQKVQTSLLRVVESGEITRLGESRPRKVNVRVIAATNRDLNVEVLRGNFRSDLLYRLRVARILLPPLRERPDDIPLLAAEFLRIAGAAAGKQELTFSKDALRALLDCPWPGNVRELKSAIQSSVLHCRGRVIRAADLASEVTSGHPDAEPLPDLQDVERERILRALEESNGNRSGAARLLGMSRATFYRHLKRLGLEV